MVTQVTTVTLCELTPYEHLNAFKYKLNQRLFTERSLAIGGTNIFDKFELSHNLTAPYPQLPAKPSEYHSYLYGTMSISGREVPSG